MPLIYLPARRIFFASFFIKVTSFVILKILFEHGHRSKLFYVRKIKPITTKAPLSTATNNHIMMMQERATEEESYIKVLSHIFIMYSFPSFNKKESNFKALVSCDGYNMRKQNNGDVGYVLCRF